MTLYVKPSGVEIEANDADDKTKSYLTSLGWKVKKDEPKREAKSKTKGK